MYLLDEEKNEGFIPLTKKTLLAERKRKRKRKFPQLPLRSPITSSRRQAKPGMYVCTVRSGFSRGSPTISAVLTIVFLLSLDTHGRNA
jgi:hypothetical protein